MSISEILYKLLGEIEPYGDTRIDEERYNNLQNYYEALMYIVSRIKTSANLKDRKEFSINKIAKESNEILEELKELLEEE